MSTETSQSRTPYYVENVFDGRLYARYVVENFRESLYRFDVVVGSVIRNTVSVRARFHVSISN